MGKMANNLPPDRDQAILDALRARLEQGSDWPALADRLVSHLARPAVISSSGEEDDLLSLVVSDALKGIDIPTRYPEFFQRLLAEDELRQAFLEALDLIESGPAATPEFTPTVSESSLSFLKSASAQPMLQQPSPGHWRVSWQQTIEQLQATFFPVRRASAPAYRHADDFEDSWFTLFRGDIELDQTRLAVLLEAVLRLDAPNALNVQLAVGIIPDPIESTAPLPDLRATLDWGSYNATVAVGQWGRATFPAVPLDVILDEANRRITSDLRLGLELVSPSS